jgi:hypothetical protein
MRILSIISLMAWSGSLLAADPFVPANEGKNSPAPLAPSQASEVRPATKLEGPPWLGFQVIRPDESTRAHLPELPAGMGFVIRSVDPKGPAETSGLKPLDVVWKFEDQYLINEGQLAVLLGQKKPGDVVNIALFRGGRQMEIPLSIGSFPLNQPLPIGPTVENYVMSEESALPTRIINFGDRTASLQVEEGKASLKRVGETGSYELEILDRNAEVIFNGRIGADGDLTTVPEAWRMRVRALRRGLDNAVSGRMDHVRQPRPRVLPKEPAVAK